MAGINFTQIILCFFLFLLYYLIQTQENFIMTLFYLIIFIITFILIMANFTFKRGTK